MNEQYLWDRSGPPDAEVQRLERTLAPLGYGCRAPLPRDAHRSRSFYGRLRQPL